MHDQEKINNLVYSELFDSFTNLDDLAFATTYGDVEFIIDISKIKVIYTHTKKYVYMSNIDDEYARRYEHWSTSSFVIKDREYTKKYSHMAATILILENNVGISPGGKICISTDFTLQSL